jgi:hypothetical protein
VGYQFFGAFTDPHPDLRREFEERWPHADVLELAEPFHGWAVRFNEEAWQNEVDLPQAVTAAVLEISRRIPEIRIVLLRTECFGGDCENWGQCIRNGDVVMDEPHIDDAPRGALRRLIRNFNVDIGEREIFEPLSRAFPWKR